MHTLLNAVRTAVTNRADFAVMWDRIRMAKPMVAAGGSGGTRNDTHPPGKGPQAPAEGLWVRAPRGTLGAGPHPRVGLCGPQAMCAQWSFEPV